MTQTGFFEVDGTSLYYEISGSGPALVFIHAGVADLRMWDDQIEAFAGDFQIIRYDVRGWGKSLNPEGAYRDYENLAALLDHLGVERAAVVGCSNGGSIAIDFTLAYPDRVEALITVGSTVQGFVGSDRQAIERGWADADVAYGAGNLPDSAEIILQMWLYGHRRTRDDVDPGVRERAYAMVMHMLEIPKEHDQGEAQWLQPRALERLSEIEVPWLAMAGDQDFANVLEFQQFLETQVSGVQTAIMADAAHLPSMEKPDEFNQIIHWTFARIGR